jgi:hypothetical protein
MLDAHVSGSKVGRVLEELGHDVKATEKMERIPDDVLLELAAEEARILVTHNVKDFMQILKQRPPANPHAGVILIPRSIPHREFGAIVSGIQRTLGDLSQEDWTDRVVWMKKGE